MSLPPTPTSPPEYPPGWYPDGAHLRWWDGRHWGPFAPVGPPGTGMSLQSEEERGRSMAVISHLGFVAGFILPLILYLLEKGKPDRNRFVCHHACEALNFTITFMIVWVGSFVVMIVTSSLAIGTGDTQSFPWPFAVFFPVMFGFMGLNYLFGILGMVRANRGVWWRYPINIRFVGRGIDWQNA